VLHSTCAHRDRDDSRLLVVGSQTASLTLGPSFDHNLCCRCPNGSCEVIFDIYTSRPFQRYKEHFKARCFDLCNRALKLWESRTTPSSHFWDCESHPHTCFKVGLRHSCITFYDFLGSKLEILDHKNFGINICLKFLPNFKHTWSLSSCQKRNKLLKISK
jgi:hypothetical protein